MNPHAGTAQAYLLKLSLLLAFDRTDGNKSVFMTTEKAFRSRSLVDNTEDAHAIFGHIVMQRLCNMN